MTNALRMMVMGVTALATVGRAATTDHEEFPTPNAAVKALVEAAKANDVSRLRAIFGPGSDDIVSSGDDVADANARRHFVEVARQRAQLLMVNENDLVLHVGSDDWPLPVPLVKTDAGWQFDGKVGVQEVVNRRVGRNELHTMDVIRAYVRAQQEYAKADRGSGRREYAQRMLSTEGKHDGLYWPAEDERHESPLGPLVAEATAENYALTKPTEGPKPYHGYAFRILTAQGPAAGGEKSYVKDGHMTEGFALVAYPVEYGASGIMTFVVNQRGIIFQKNLGAQTAEVAKDMKAYNPDDSWDPVPPEPLL